MKKLSLILIVIVVFNSLCVTSAYADTAYTVQKLGIGGLSYNPITKTLTARAEIVTEVSSAPIAGTPPTSGTIILAAYRRGELTAINIAPYSGLSADNPYETELELDLTNGVYVKAFILDSIQDLTPLTTVEECNDISQLIVYEQVILDSDTVIQSYYNFETDPRKYDEQVKSWDMQYVPGAETNSVGICQEDSGNNYLSIKSIGTSESNPFAIVSCNNQQRLVVEFDVQSPTATNVNFFAYDTNGERVSLLDSDANGNLRSGSVSYVGALKPDGWTKVAMVIDNVQNLLNFYVDGEHTGIDIPMASDVLSDVRALRIYGMRNQSENEVMLDNIVVYSGNILYDFSKTLSGEVDENVIIYNYNTSGIEQLLQSYSAIHTATGKLYSGSMDSVSKMPYYENGTLYVTLADAERLVFGVSTSASDEYVALDSFVAKNGKKLTFTKTGTVLVGDKTAALTDSMIKLLNAYMTYDRPDTSTLEAAFSGERPRLTLNRQKLEQIKSAYSDSTNSYITDWCNRIISDADKYLTLPPQEYIAPTNNGGRLLVPGKTIKERIQKLAIAFHLTNNNEYVTRAWKEIENACSFPNWHQGIHELDSATMASAIAFGYDWLYDQWDPDTQLKIMEEAIFEKQLDQAYEAYHGSRVFGWAVSTNNWNAWCNGYTALAACAVYEAAPHKCADIISNAISNSEAALVEFYPSGAWKEGTSYWNGTVESYAEMFTTIKNVFGSYYNLQNTAYMDVTSNYVLASSGPAGTNNYNDSNHTPYSTTPTMLWFSNVYVNPSLTSIRLDEIDKGVAEPSVLDLCYYDSKSEPTGVDLPLDSYYEVLELVSLRSAWNDTDASYISFHSGNNLNADAHSHIDSGTFVLDMLGERFAVDPGSHYYYCTGHGQAPETQPTYDTITRWNYYHHVPEGHNCFVINPDQTIGQNIVTDDKIEEFASSEKTSYAITSLSSAYNGYAKSARRGIMLSDNRKCVTIRDEIELNDGDNEIFWFMHKSIDCQIEMLDDTSFIMTQNGQKVKVMFITNADTAQVYEADPVHMVRTPPAEQETIDDLNKLVIKMSASGSVYLQVKFIPLDGENNTVTMENTSLDNWKIN